MDGYTIAVIEEKNRALSKFLSRDNSVAFSFDKSHLDMLKDYLDELPKSFIPNLTKYGLALLYVYDREAQPEKGRKTYGLTYECWKRDKEANEKTRDCAIGISTEALDRGKEFALAVFVHEAAHVLTFEEGHTELFGIVLDGLLARCAEAGLALERLPYPSDAQRGHRARD